MSLSLEELHRRLLELESEKQIRICMNRYMYLCDQLTVGFDLDSLLNLFSNDAVWEGKGSRYEKTFGRYEGISAIKAMFEKYVLPPAHFSLNVHVLGNEVIDVSGSTAKGTWVLVQPSSFSSGKSQLSCARITSEFKLIDGQWLISHFITENLFSRPMVQAWNHSEDLPVPE